MTAAMLLMGPGCSRVTPRLTFSTTGQTDESHWEEGSMCGSVFQHARLVMSSFALGAARQGYVLHARTPGAPLSYLLKVSGS